MNCNPIREMIEQSARREGFNETVRAHLSGCGDCRRHAEQHKTLLSLINAVPRVEAPADFDFRVRALIARSKSEPAAKGLLEQFWTRSFSLGQTATALAAVAMAIFASTFYFTQPAEKTASNNDVAVTEPKVIPEPGTTQPEQSSVAKAPTAISPIRMSRVRTGGGLRYAKPSGLQPASLETVVSATDRSTRVFNRANGQVIHNRDFIGAEGVGAARPQTLALSF